MKKQLLFLVTVGLAATLFSCKKDLPQGNLRLKGSVVGLKKGILYLHKIQDTSWVTLDSILINGDAVFDRNFTIDSPEMYYLTLDRGTSSSIDNQLMFFAEPGTITIETSLKNFYNDAKISGSKSQEIYQEYLKTRSDLVHRENETLVALLQSEHSGDLAAKDSLLNLSKRLTARKYLNAVNFALNHKDSDVAPYIALVDLYDRQIKYLDTINNSLTSAVKNGHYGSMLADYIQERKAEEALLEETANE